MSNTYREALYKSNGAGDARQSPGNDNWSGVTDFKGIFGTVSGLAEEFPDRVIETPLAEDSIAGVCIGAALNGMYPINTHPCRFRSPDL